MHGKDSDITFLCLCDLLGEKLTSEEKQELRNQLEAHLLTIEKLRAESRAVTARHDAVGFQHFYLPRLEENCGLES